MKTLFLLLVPIFCFAQADSAIVTISGGNPNLGYTTIIHYTSNVADYVCKAVSTQPLDPINSYVTVTAISNANPGVMTAASHGFYYATGVTQKFVAYISGLTGNWTPLNGLHVLTPASSGTLNTDVDTTSFGSLTGTIVVQTRAPKATAKVWAVQALVSDASGNLTISAWSVPTTGTGSGQSGIASLTGGSPAFKFPCSAPGAYQ